MATKSFCDDRLVINDSNVKRFCDIMETERKVKIAKVTGHKAVKSKKAIKTLLGI